MQDTDLGMPALSMDAEQLSVRVKRVALRTLAGCKFWNWRSVPVFSGHHGFTASHQFAVLAEQYGGGQNASKTLRKAGFLACGIGLPVPEVKGDLNGLRIGTPELVRWGMTSEHADHLATLIARGLKGDAIAAEVTDWRCEFDNVHFVHG